MIANHSLRTLFARSGLPNLTRLLLVRGKRFALLFHGISSRKHPELPTDIQPYLSASEFRYILAWLGGHFEFLSPHEFFHTLRPGVLLTFDDGLANNYNNALSILEEFVAPAVFFVTTQHVIDPQNWLPATRNLVRSHWPSEEAVPAHLGVDFYNGLSEEQLRCLSDHPLATIASHTVSHPLLTRCNLDELRQELVDSKGYLEIITGQNVDLFAYPTGDYNLEVAKAVRDSGYRAAFITNPKPVGLPGYEIPRVGIYDSDPAYLSLKLSGLHKPALGEIKVDQLTGEEFAAP